MSTLSLLDEILNIFSNDGTIDDNVHIDLSVFEYCMLLHDAFINNDCKFEKLMNLCVEISFWITTPNESIHQYELQKYSILHKYFYQNISEIIISFLFNPLNYLKWTHFTNTNRKLITKMSEIEFIEFLIKQFYLTSIHNFDSKQCQTILLNNNMTPNTFNKLSKEEFCAIGIKSGIQDPENAFFRIKAMLMMEKNTKYQQQLRYSMNDSIVDLSNMQYDIINVRTELLSFYTQYIINIYCFEKGDELWLGLVSNKAYDPSTYFRKYKYGLFYYGGRQRSIKLEGGAINDQCIAKNNLFGNNDGSDCNHGSIQGFGKVIKHPLPSYSAGDWIRFEIDFERKSIIIYKNGVQQYILENKKYFPNDQCYFIVELDYRRDKVYIEQTSHVSKFKAS